MLSIPLPLIAGAVFVLTLRHSLKGVEFPGSRRYFNAFLVLYALQGVGIGLRFGYGVESLAALLPTTASTMPPLAFLAFRSLSGVSIERPWLHGLPPLAVAVASFTLRDLVDPLLLLIFSAYAVSLFRLTLTHGEAAMAETALARMHPALRAARLTAALMLFFALSDAALAVYTGIHGPGSVPLAVTAINLAALVAVAIYYFWPHHQPVAVSETGKPDPQDQTLVTRASALLEESDLFRDENLSLAKISRKLGVPARDLSSAINRATGQNVSQFVNNRRVVEACRLLDETKQSATSIMFDVGFSTKSNFNREFRRVTGMSPRQWRARAADAAAAHPQQL